VGIGVFKDIGVDLIKRAIEEEMRTVGAEKKWYASAIQMLIRKGYRVRSLDIEDLFWIDVDYPSDLFKARFNSDKFIKKSQKERVLRVVETNP
jgi:choline kinase